jgi:putative flippase GtrA
VSAELWSALSLASDARAATVTLDVVVPVYNEEADLAASVDRLLEHLAAMPWSFRVTIADNASTDGTAVIARRLAHVHDLVRVVHLAEKGRGRALKRVWSESDADVLVYMDVDLSTDLNALLPLVAPLISGHSDLAIGSRLRPGSRVTRGPKREVISRGYNLLVRQALRTRFSDAQCGFKAIRRDVAREVLPLVEDDAWFFDTELLVLAERAGLRIHEVPVDWVDDPDSRVDLVRTAYDDVRGIARLGRNLVAGRIPLADVTERFGRVSADAHSGRLGMQLVVFALVGALSTVAYAALYLAFRGPLGGSMGAQEANLLALLITAIGNTAANRRFTFGVRGPTDRLRHQLQGLAIFAIGLGVTSGSLWLLNATGSTHHGVEVAVLTVANLAVTCGRFVAMRTWVFVRRRAGRR